MNRIFSFLILLLLALTAPAQVRAAASGWQKHEGVAVRLMSAQDAIDSGKEFMLGLEVQLAEGWHIYWRSPGETGSPPDLQWRGSDNLADLTFLFPAPRRYDLLGMDTIGYNGAVVFPLRASVKTPNKALTLRAPLDMLACSTLCVPKHFDLTLTLPAGASPTAPRKR
jgi:suppressor for copper-sensitivity B